MSTTKDPGGETKFGVTKRTYPLENIKAMTLERAKVLYLRDCWGPPGACVSRDLFLISTVGRCIPHRGSLCRSRLESSLCLRLWSPTRNGCSAVISFWTWPAGVMRSRSTARSTSK